MCVKFLLILCIPEKLFAYVKTQFHPEIMNTLHMSFRLYSATSSQEIDLVVSQLICDWSKCTVRAEIVSIPGVNSSSNTHLLYAYVECN